MEAVVEIRESMDKIWLKSMNVCAPTCHQRVERSFFFKNYQLPVCARCLGIYIGLFTSLFFRFPYAILLIPITYIDGFVQLKTNYESTNIRRLITGLLSGFGIMQLLLIIITAILSHI